jgi:hypothetical protein
LATFDTIAWGAVGTLMELEVTLRASELIDVAKTITKKYL